MTKDVRLDPSWIVPFLTALATTGKIGEAAKGVPISTGTVDDRRKRYPKFAADCRVALVRGAARGL